MQWVKTLNLDKNHIIFLLGFVIVFFVTRLPGLANDTINPDAVNWHYRSEQFVVGIKHQVFEKTYQHYHPGVTLMWVTGIPIEIYKQMSGVEVYNQYSFYAFHYVAKFSLILVQLGLSIFLVFWLSREISFEKALLVIAILSLEPFFVGNSRLFHMDVLFTLLTFGSLVTGYHFVKGKGEKWILLSSFLMGLTLLTKSIGLGVALYVFGIALLHRKNFIKATFIFLVTVFAFFPALWSRPAEVMTDIFSEGTRVGVRNGHTQIYFNSLTENPGLSFYPVSLAMKLSPFIIVGVILYFITLKKTKPNFGLTSYLTLFYLGYFIVMSFPSKKIDRYMLMLFPYFSYLTVLGYYRVLKLLGEKNQFFRYSTVLLFLLFVVIPLISNHPYNFTYTSPIFGSAANANRVIGQKPFGVGIYEVKDQLQRVYGANTSVGFIDTKPIKSIYPNSLVYDTRIDGTSNYDVMVLAINEEFPENVVKSGTKFKKDSSIYINGLEYWRFYVKE